MSVGSNDEPLPWALIIPPVDVGSREARDGSPAEAKWTCPLCRGRRAPPQILDYEPLIHNRAAVEGRALHVSSPDRLPLPLVSRPCCFFPSLPLSCTLSIHPPVNLPSAVSFILLSPTGRCSYCPITMVIKEEEEEEKEKTQEAGDARTAACCLAAT